MFSCRMKLGNLLCLKYLQGKRLHQPSGAFLTAKMEAMRCRDQHPTWEGHFEKIRLPSKRQSCTQYSLCYCTLPTQGRANL